MIKVLLTGILDCPAVGTKVEGGTQGLTVHFLTHDTIEANIASFLCGTIGAIDKHGYYLTINGTKMPIDCCSNIRTFYNWLNI